MPNSFAHPIADVGCNFLRILKFRAAFLDKGDVSHRNSRRFRAGDALQRIETFKLEQKQQQIGKRR